jgi:hypothetical protein
MILKFYLIYIPDGNTTQWEAMSDLSVPDPEAFPSYWYKSYEVDTEKYPDILSRLMKSRDKMNQQGIIPCKNRSIFPELEDILKSNNL